MTRLKILAPATDGQAQSVPALALAVDAGEPADPTELVPPDTPLSAYLDWARSVQGSPPVFHLAAALAFAGYTLCRRGFFLQTPLEEIYPTLWFALLGESGTGKSTAVSMVESFATAVHKELGLPDFEFLEPAGSIPGILHAMQEHYDERRGTTVGLLCQDELAMLIASREPIAELLCKLHDGRTVQHHTVTARRKKTAGGEDSVKLVQPRMCALFASTEAQLQPHFKEAHRSGGLFARLQWVRPVVRGEHLRNTLGTEEQIEAAVAARTRAVYEWANWEGRLSELASERTSLHVTPAASDCINDAFLGDAARQLDLDQGDDMHGTRMRTIRRAQVLGLIFATSRGSLLVEDIDAEAAVAVAKAFYGHAEAASDLGSSLAYRHAEKVERAVLREGEHGAKLRQLYKATRLGKLEMDLAVQQLLDRELIVVAREANMLRPGAYVHASTEVGKRALDESRAGDRLAQALAVMQVDAMKKRGRD